MIFLISLNTMTTMDTMSESHIECDCCSDNEVSQSLTKLFQHRRTHNLPSSDDDYSKNNNFQKLCYYCPSHFDCMPFFDGYLIIKKEKPGPELQTSSSCDDCQKNFSTKKRLYHGCQLCNISSIRTCRQLYHHLQYDHNIENPYQCLVCGVFYPRLLNLKNHIRKHTTGRYKCEQCSKSFYLERSLKEHRYVHTNEHKFACEFCDKKFIHPRTLRQHTAVHSNLKYDCDICPKICTTKSRLKWHMKNCHTTSESIKKFQCNQCPKVYVHKLNLNIHLKRHQISSNGLSEKRFKCDQCQKSYLNKEYLRDHKNVVHRGEKPYECSLCDQKFATPYFLRNHKCTDLVDGKQFDCNICQKMFSCSSALNRHIKYIHNEPKSYPCDLCDKIYSKRINLENHRKVHTGEPLNECHLCHKIFVHPSSLQQHLKQMNINGHKKEKKL